VTGQLKPAHLDLNTILAELISPIYKEIALVILKKVLAKKVLVNYKPGYSHH